MPSTPASNKAGPLLAIDRLSVRFSGNGRETEPVRQVSFSVEHGEMLAIVGESGSGKSLTALSILKLMPGNAGFSGSIRLEGEDQHDLPGADDLAEPPARHWPPD